MENLVTPSERAQSLINPHTRSRADGDSPQDKVILGLKIILGTPIPVLLMLYICGLVISEWFLSWVAGLTCLLSFLYILVDRFSQPRELKLFVNITDLPMAAFLLITLLSSLIHWDSGGLEMGLLGASWIVTFFLLTYSFFLFPGLNLLFRTLAVVVPLMCVFVIWQKFYGLKVNLSALPDTLAHAVAGIDTVGLFDSPAPFVFAVGSFISFATATLFVHTSRPRSFQFLTVGALAVAWLSLVGIQSLAVLIAVLAAVLVILLYCQRTYFFLLIALVALFVFVVPQDYTFYKTFSPWMDRGDDITQEKRDVSRAELAMFQDSIWFGVGPHQNLLPKYFKKLEIKREGSKITSNNYFALLASTGIIGFALFTIITLAFFMKAHRLWNEIPRTHYWHRAFVMGCLGSQIVFHVLGLYQTMLQSLAVLLIFTFFLAIINYMNESYSRGIIPDDYSL